MKTLKPFCRCGCGRRVKRLPNVHYERACRPKESFSAASRKGNRAYSYKSRRLKFQAELEQLPQRLTREDLVAAFYRIYRRAYNSGWNACKLGLKQKPAIRDVA
jgi:hypothetical protein